MDFFWCIIAWYFNYNLGHCVNFTHFLSNDFTSGDQTRHRHWVFWFERCDLRKNVDILSLKGHLVLLPAEFIIAPKVASEKSHLPGDLKHGCGWLSSYGTEFVFIWGLSSGSFPDSLEWLEFIIFSCSWFPKTHNPRINVACLINVMAKCLRRLH